MRGASLDIYDLAALGAANGTELGNTIFVGKLHFFPQVDSTNSEALAGARDGAPHGSVTWATMAPV